MLRLGQLGYVSLLGSIVSLIMQGIASVLNEEFILKDLRLVNIIDAEIYDWAAGITLFSFNSLVEFLVNLQLFAFLFILAVLFFILSGIFERSRV